MAIRSSSRLVRPLSVWCASLLIASTCAFASFAQADQRLTRSTPELRQLNPDGPPAQPASNDRASAAREDLRAQVQAWVAQVTVSAPDSVEVGALDSRVDPSTCEQGYTFDFPFQTRTTVRARCNHPARQLYLRVGIQSMEPRLTVNRNLPAGHILSATDLSSRMSRKQASGQLNESMAIGRALTRPLAAGAFIEQRDLDEAMTVARTIAPLAAGDRVTPGALRLETVSRRQAPRGSVNASELNNLTLRRSVPAGHILQEDDLVDARPVLVARRTLMRGEKLNESMFEVVSRDRREIPPDHLLSTEGLANAELIAPIQAGAPLRTSQFRRSNVVRKGQLVVLTVNRSGIEISVRVEALEDARIGDQLRLRNPDSGKTLAGIATGQGTARAL